MTDVQLLTERDILVKIDTTLNVSVIPAIEKLDERQGHLETRVAALEKGVATQAGMFSGAKMLWGILAALPVGGLAFIFGQAQ